MFAAKRIRRGIGLSSRRFLHDGSNTREGWLFVDSVFPVQLGVWDVRSFMFRLRQDTLLAELKAKLSRVQAHKFTILELEPHLKDGGVFVHFKYALPDSGEEDLTSTEDSEDPHPIDSTSSTTSRSGDQTPQERRVLHELERLLNEEADNAGGLPSWNGIWRGNVWLVQGSPWREDMNRFAFSMLRVTFEGPDVPEQTLYQLFRPYGRIQDLTMPTTVPAGTPRSSVITFSRIRPAAIARNVVHGLEIASTPGADNAGKGTRTRLRIAYQKPIRAHVIRDWTANHPRIVIPVIVFLLGSITYTVFDPVRAMMVQAKMQNWFDYRGMYDPTHNKQSRNLTPLPLEWTVYKWACNMLPTQLISYLASDTHSSSSKNKRSLSSAMRAQRSKELSADLEIQGVWKERQEVERTIKTYLDDFPTTVAFLHGPQGSGKSRLLETMIQDSDRHVLHIDCRDLQKATSDPQLVGALARQTGYWPVFTFLDSMSSLLDLASVGLIGQKAGFSSSLPDQLTQLLSVVTRALQATPASHIHAAALKRAREEQDEERKAEQNVVLHKIRHGTWHDGRLDCVAGNGVMSELGIGDEAMGVLEDEYGDDVGVMEIAGETLSEPEAMREAMMELGRTDREDGEVGRPKEKKNGHHRPPVADAEAISAIPIVIIRNYSPSNRAGGSKEDLLTVLAQWAAGLAENRIAHVIVVSDNRENAKRLAKAIPSKPINSIALSDADTSSALSFVKQRLRDSDIDVHFTRSETELVERLGGRASDLESLIHKVTNGQGVAEAVEDIVVRGVGELRKSAFGDDVDDAKSLAWSREQAWAVLKLLAKKPEVSYHEVLIEFPFKGDESPLRNMEHAELIAIGTVNGRPSTIRPGKPVYKYVFERLVKDPIFQANQDIAYNNKLISSAESTIKLCEEELGTLENIREQETRTRGWGDWAFGWMWGMRVCDARAAYLLDKMGKAGKKVEVLERKNEELKKVLATVE
ncbi:mitochondrial escape protein 2 [Pleurotus pulmonarius]|nr:mitochondrial escape protein 2 [Pleurotus pulmonarius]